MKPNHNNTSKNTVICTDSRNWNFSRNQVISNTMCKKQSQLLCSQPVLDTAYSYSKTAKAGVPFYISNSIEYQYHISIFLPTIDYRLDFEL